MPLYSHNRLSVFQYLDRLEVPDGAEAIQLFLGSRVHEALEALHRELVRERRWEEVSEVSVRAVGRALNEGDWPASLRAAGGQFASWVKSVRVRLVKVRCDEE